MQVLMDVRPLRVAAFRRVWVAAAVTGIGAQLTAVAVPVQVFQLTGSSAWVGVASLVGLVPMVGGALWGGALADGWDRRRILLVTTAGIAAVSVALAGWAVLGAHSIGVMLVLVALQQGLFGANGAVGGAVVPRLVAGEQLPAAIALQSTVVWGAGVGGPLLAGVLLPLVGAAPLYLADAAAVAATWWAVWRLPALPPQGAPAGGGVGLRRIGEGLGVLARHPVLRAAWLVDAAALTFGLPVALFPQLAAGRFGGIGAVGILTAAVSAGSVLAGLLSGAFSRVRRHGLALVVGVAGWSAALAAFGTAGSLPVAVGLLVAAGAALMVLSVFRKALVQTAVGDELRGRIQGADLVVAAGGPRLAGVVHGAAAAVVGPGAATAGGAIAALAVTLAVAAATPALCRYRAG